MYKGYYQFADITVEIRSIYPFIHTMCADYAVDPTDDAVSIDMADEDVQREADYSAEERRIEGLAPYKYAEDYLETLAVYRKLATQFVRQGVMLMHGSVIAVDGEAYMFTAASGTGKSTHVGFWRQLFGDRAVMVNDDKPLIRVSEPRVYGTPWDGKHHLSNNISAPLKAICILERGEQNEVERLTVGQAAAMLLQQSFRPSDAASMIAALQLVSALAENVSLYRMRCNLDPDAARVAYEAMNKN